MTVEWRQRKALTRKIRQIAFQKGIKDAYSLEVKEDGRVTLKKNAMPLSFSDVNTLLNIWETINSGLHMTSVACGFSGRLTLQV